MIDSWRVSGVMLLFHSSEERGMTPETHQVSKHLFPGRVTLRSSWSRSVLLNVFLLACVYPFVYVDLIERINGNAQGGSTLLYVFCSSFGGLLGWWRAAPLMAIAERIWGSPLGLALKCFLDKILLTEAFLCFGIKSQTAFTNSLNR